MSWLNTALVAAIASNGVLFLLFLLVLLVYRRPFLGFWAACWGSYEITLLCNTARVFHGAHWAYWAGQYSTALLSAWFLLLGTAAFCSRRVPAWWHAVLAVPCAWVWLGMALGQPASAFMVPVFLVTAALQIVAGYLLLQASQVAGKGRLWAGCVMIVWGLHRADYPFLRVVDWFAPWGFVLASLFSFFVALCLAFLLVESLMNELKRTHGSLDTIMQVAPVGLGLAKDRVIKWNNPFLERLLGWEEGDLLDQSTALIYRDEAEFQRVGREFYGQIEQQGILEMEVELRHKDGAVLPCQLLGRQLTLDGVDQGIIVAIADLSQQKRAQEGLRRLAAGVAHNFNNVLMAITSNAQAAQVMLQNELYDVAGLKLLLDNVVKGALGGKDVAGRLAASVARRPPDSQSWEYLDLSDLVENSLSLAFNNYASVTSGRVRLLNQVPPGLTVRGVSGELTEVILNLVDNAVAAMPGGGDLTVTGREENGAARLVFADQGEGMDAATRERAFEPFFTTKGREGQGLGLNSSQGLVESHGGSMRLVSKPGQGAEVTVLLPLARPEQERRPEEAPVRSEAARILLVEDEFLTAMWLKTLLESNGYLVERAACLEEAENVLERMAPNLVVSDYYLPDGTAADFLAGRPGPGKSGQLPVLVVTGWAEAEYDATIKRAMPNCREVVQKPITEEVFLAKVSQVLQEEKGPDGMAEAG